MILPDDAASAPTLSGAPREIREAASPPLEAAPETPPVVLDFQEIGDHLYDGVYIADGRGRTLYVNRSYQRITGIDRSELIGRTVTELVAAGLYTNPVTPEVLRSRRQVHSVGQSRRNGARMLITGNPIFGAAGEIKLVAVIEREITDLHQMQIELEASQEKIRAAEAEESLARREVEHLRSQVRTGDLVGSSASIRAVVDTIRRIADFDVTVLVRGETGVGKEVVANELHAASSRAHRPFVKVNCAALPAQLIEAELFGFERGAFTGAAPAGRIGLFELADKGTILLDEIGDMPLELQGKLLRVLQDKQVTRIGGGRPKQVDVRIIAATNRDLRTAAREGRFREDLYYRLAVLPIEIAPLRERPEDIALLARHFLEIHNRRCGKSVTLGLEALDMLAAYRWPGHVRELQNVVERLVLVSDRKTIVGRNHVAPLLDLETTVATAEGGSLPARVEDLERRLISEAMESHRSTRRAAIALGIDQSTLVKKARRLGICLR